MKSFHEQMADYLTKHNLLESGDRVLLGCSGGIDSMVLLHYLKSQEKALEIRVEAIHVNHMLRGEESAADRLFTEQVCRLWEIPCHSSDIPIPAILKTVGGNKQQVCRVERYKYFAEIMEQTGATKLVTAHHADDQLETILMSGLRGTLQSGSFGMPAIRPFEGGMLIRPLLAVTKQEIADYAETFNIPYREDSSNAENTYTRNRIRKNVVPELKKENADVSKQFVELSDSLQEDQNFLMELAQEKLELLVSTDEHGTVLSAERFRSHASALQKRMVLLLLNYLYGSEQVIVTRQLAEQVQDMMQSSSGTVFLHLPQHYRMIRQYDRVLFSRRDSEAVSEEFHSSITDEWTGAVKNFRYKLLPVQQLREQEDAIAWYFSESAEPQLQIRSRLPGDRIHLSGMAHSKKVARLMIDEKVPAPLRKGWPVITDSNGEVLLVPGLRPSRHISRSRRPQDNWVLMEQKCEDRESEL
ncbi:tRNA lysidine(34) synthetase TilS [Planococcus sp. CAU13]|uniref:tRNA lysidine(34) synthetase TilS n=1 Tax=Planococcus sp. CAU13 TaxID=1541197 RepID=UPI00052FE0CE|nr:tRNA lysidine(34) synthetase TilS [Planococcus sp. CAU13]